MIRHFDTLIHVVQVEGVGLGSVAAAAKHETVDVKSLITWQPDSPVPFAFLAKVCQD